MYFTDGPKKTSGRTSVFPDFVSPSFFAFRYSVSVCMRRFDRNSFATLVRSCDGTAEECLSIRMTVGERVYGIGTTVSLFGGYFAKPGGTNAKVPPVVGGAEEK